mmetsp:Transcript_15321/g.25886  ORF Transcript_15321/g.25886 Transcript_15321/m.25886 type:complete len:104 (+) Transcript_15321:704-1015(+)
MIFDEDDFEAQTGIKKERGEENKEEEVKFRVADTETETRTSNDLTASFALSAAGDSVKSPLIDSNGNAKDEMEDNIELTEQERVEQQMLTIEDDHLKEVYREA